MARWIAKGTLQALATEFGVTPAQVRSFLTTQRNNGNIAAVLAFVEANQGATDAEVEAGAVAGGIDPTTTTRILALLKSAGYVESF